MASASRPLGESQSRHRVHAAEPAGGEAATAGGPGGEIAERHLDAVSPIRFLRFLDVFGF